MSELKTNKISTNDQNNVAIDNALGLKSYTTTARNALTSVAGDMIYNTSDSKVQVHNGSAWEDVGGANTFAIDYLLIGGGGATNGQGGGGAGGFLNSFGTENSGGGNSSLDEIGIVKGTSYTVTVGAGGAAGTNNGSNSVFSRLTAIGGGFGGGGASNNGADGGSGGGAGTQSSGTVLGSDTLVNLNLGFDGGNGASSTLTVNRGAGGGGGAGSVGVNGTAGTGGAGGAGVTSSITGSAVTRAGGGGGFGGTTGGAAGTGGGGLGETNPNNDNTNGTANTGGGGGGGTPITNGGSGVVILRWATADATIGATRTGLTDGGVQTDGSDSYIVFTAGTGTISFS